MKLKIPWWAVSQVIIEQVKKTVEDMREAIYQAIVSFIKV